MCLFAGFLHLLQFVVKILEGLIPVILATNVGAEATEFIELLLDFLRGNLDVRPNTLNVLGMVHLRPCVSNNSYAMGQKLVAVLWVC